jgi:hypothetical protein
VGHWKLVLQFFVSAIDTKDIMWKSVDWNSQQLKKWHAAIDWSFSLAITVSFPLVSMLAFDPWRWVNFIFYYNCIICSVIVLVALFSIRNLLGSNKDISKS